MALNILPQKSYEFYFGAFENIKSIMIKLLVVFKLFKLSTVLFFSSYS